MKIIVLALLGLTPSLVMAGQTGERQKGAMVMADYNYNTRLDGCAVSGQGGAMTLSGRLFVRFQPDQRLGADDGMDVDVATSASGAPSVSAHAINTKGTGSNNGRAAAPLAMTVCAVSPSTGTAGRSIASGSSCRIDSSADGATVTFNLPLSAFGSSEKNYTGHVTLMKRGDSAGAMRIVAQCSGMSASRASYDLATLKK